MGNRILNINEVSPDKWEATYQGHFGIYTIKVKGNGEEILSATCNCPSKHAHCKHIPIVQKAILDAKNNHGVDVEFATTVLSVLSDDELRNFVSQQLEHNVHFRQQLVDEFKELCHD